MAEGIAWTPNGRMLLAQSMVDIAGVREVQWEGVEGGRAGKRSAAVRRACDLKALRAVAVRVMHADNARIVSDAVRRFSSKKVCSAASRPAKA
jgi:hypothetical protein